MKTNRYGRAEILTPNQINLLFNEGFSNPRDRALFGVCLYAATRINEACTLLRGNGYLWGCLLSLMILSPFQISIDAIYFGVSFTQSHS